MGYKPTLKVYTTTADEFNKVLEYWGHRVITVPDFQNYTKGYSNNKDVIYNGLDSLIILDRRLYQALDLKLQFKNVSYIVKIGNAKDVLEPDTNGGYSWNYIWNLKILKYYSEEEAVKILKSYTNAYDPRNNQWHHVAFGTGYNVWNGCYKYDINGAHADALCEIFPKAANALKAVRKLKMGKKYLNYFVGMLKKKGYEGCYNYIVQRTTAKLVKAVEYVGGDLLYVNTDGFLVNNINKELPTSAELGDFKLEFKGTVYSYVDKNYFVFQLDNKDKSKTGSCLDIIKKDIDLKNKLVVHYDRKLNQYGQTEAKNIIKEYL